MENKQVAIQNIENVISNTWPAQHSSLDDAGGENCKRCTILHVLKMDISGLLGYP